MFQDRYAFGKVSSVSFLGGRPAGMGIDIVTTGSTCREYRSTELITIIQITLIINDKVSKDEEYNVHEAGCSLLN